MERRKNEGIEEKMKGLTEERKARGREVKKARVELKVFPTCESLASSQALIRTGHGVVWEMGRIALISLLKDA